MGRAKKTTKKSDEVKEITEKQANEARELGIEPSGFSDGKQLQERIDHVKAEKKAVGNDTSISKARSAEPATDEVETETEE